MSQSRAVTQRQTVDTFIDAWERLSIKDMVALRTSDCIQTVHPQDSMGMQEQMNEDFAVAMTPIFGTLSNFVVNIISTTNDGEAGRAVIHATTKANATWGDYRNEHMMILTFNEDGSKMTKVQDMVDSAEMLKRMPLVADYLKSLS